MTRPVFSRTRATVRASFFSSAQTSAVRRHCQTMARSMGLRVARSHTRVVSRWLVIPMAAMSSPAHAGGLQSAPATLARRWPRSRRRRATPSPAWGSAAGTPCWHGRACPVERQDQGGRPGRSLVDGQQMVGLGHGREGSRDVHSPSRGVSRDNGRAGWTETRSTSSGDAGRAVPRRRVRRQGDLSVVYKGHHIGVDAPVAIKCLDLPTTLDGALVRPLVETLPGGEPPPLQAVAAAT